MGDGGEAKAAVGSDGRRWEEGTSSDRKWLEAVGRHRQR